MIKSLYAICVFMGFTACSTVRKDKELPGMDFRFLDSTKVFNTRGIERGQPFVIVYFKTDCSLCQKETEDFLGNMSKMNSIQFYFLSTDTYERLKVFNKVYEIGHYPNVFLLQDYKYHFVEYFRPSMVPYVLVFDKGKVLRFVYIGGTTSDKLITALKEVV